ncbi:MAG: hypothetical protein NXI22_04640, partial [bacterium]|nr:hypothetical protein [bacterium]
VLPRPTRISVEPAYTLSVQEDLVTLEARFGYNIRGASELKVDMKGWTVVSVQPDTAVEIDQLNLDSTSPLLIPLTPLTQQEKRNLPIIVTATMPIAADGGFSLSLPMPVATTISPALVAIQPASDVLLELAAAQMSGLTAEPIPANGANPVADAALLFRTRGQFGTATIAGKVARRDRKITVTQDVSVDVTVASINVNQQFFIQIDHQSTREIVLLVPTSVVQSGDLELTHGVQDLSWKAGEVDPADDQVTPVIVDLQGDRRGDFPLLASWRSPAKLTPNHDGAASELQLGLIRLSEDSVDRDDGVRLTLFLEASMRVSDIADGWNVAETAGVFVAARERSPAEITLQITRSETVGAADVIVQRAWLQTWYSAGRRRDRAVFRVKTARNSLSIRVGERFQSESLQAAVDGVRLDSVLQLESGVHVIPLVSFTPDDSHTIELWYGVDDGGFNWGRVQASPPIIEDASPTQRFYWQLATPAGSQLTFAPSDMDDELGWDWRQLYFQRASALNQSDLENWSHASKQQDLPKSANQYVFSTFGAPEAITARVMNRWLLAAIAAITALAVGFAVFSLSFFRRPVILLAGAAVLAVAATAAPGFAMVAGQWAFWGIAALVVVRLVDWTLLRRKTGRSATVVVQPAESIDSTYAQREDSDSGVDYSTATAPHLRHAASSPNG